MGTIDFCPRCEVTPLLTPITFNAISVVDDKTFICKVCGKAEARVNYYAYKKALKKIPIDEITMENKFRTKLNKPTIGGN